MRERASDGGLRFSVSPDVERLWLELWRALRVQSPPCRTFPVPVRLLALRAVPRFQRWIAIITEPEWLRALAAVRRRLAEVPEILSCRIERIDGRAVHLALVTIGLERETVRVLIERRLEEYGRPAAFELLARGEEAHDDADLR